MRNLVLRQSLALALIASFTSASIDWNLESTFLQHLQQQANEMESTEHGKAIEGDEQAL